LDGSTGVELAKVPEVAGRFPGFVVTAPEVEGRTPDVMGRALDETRAPDVGRAPDDIGIMIDLV
jgi:hypothetical protein